LVTRRRLVGKAYRASADPLAGCKGPLRTSEGTKGGEKMGSFPPYQKFMCFDAVGWAAGRASGL